MRRRALCGEVDTVGSLELDLERSCVVLALAVPITSQLAGPTCGSVVEVLVDELRGSC